MRSYFSSRWRLLRPVLVVVLCISLLLAYIYLQSRPSYAVYESLSESEVAQSRKFVRNTRDSKFIFFKQLQGAGFNNQAQEILLFHHLALLTSRVYIHQPLVWRRGATQSSVPLSAFLYGVTRDSITSAIFDEACRPDEVKHVNIHVDDKSLWDYAIGVLKGNDKCIVVDDWIFNWNYLASPALHVLWPTYQHYLAQHFEWSDPVRNIVSRAHLQLNLRSKLSNPDGEPYIALHLRRGDFEAHCHILAENHVGFTTWATLPLLNPSILAPMLDPANATSVLEHCYPTLERIISAIDLHARAKPHLRTLHVLHDGAWDHPLVYLQNYRLKVALTEAARGWVGGPIKHVTHSGKIPLQFGEADWAVAVDVELARRAEVFVGNGYSSLSTQVIALRLGADGGRVEDITLL